MYKIFFLRPSIGKGYGTRSACAVFSASGTALPGEPCVQVAIASDVESARVDEVRASEWGAALLELDSVHCATDLLQTDGNLCY